MTKIRRFLPVLLVLFCCVIAVRLFSSFQNEKEGQVVSVRDGDTIEVIMNGKATRVRLAYIDSPEKGQPFGNKAKQYLSDLCFKKTVSVKKTGVDQYKRVLGIVYAPNGQSLNEEMVKAGMAWCYTQYAIDPVYKKLENEARRQKRGLWADKNAVEPWMFRKQKRQSKQL